MAFPRVLKNMMLRNAGNAYLGEVASVTLPKLARKLESIRMGGMDRGAKADMGGEDLDVEHAYAAPMRDILRQYGITDLAGVQLSFVGAYVNDADGTTDAVEVFVRGRHEEIDFGEQKVGEKGDFKVKSALVYYKLVWNGVTEIEIDVLNMTEVVGGVDRLADQRNAIGI